MSKSAGRNDIPKNTELVTQNTEDDNSVYYCRCCHSLWVLEDKTLAGGGWDGSYCGKCHSTDIGICDINDWLAEEERRRKKREKIEWKK